jgi:hypothetical protein
MPQVPSTAEDALRHGRHEQSNARMSQPVIFHSACCLPMVSRSSSRPEAQEEGTGQGWEALLCHGEFPKVLAGTFAAEPSVMDANIQDGTSITDRGNVLSATSMH